MNTIVIEVLGGVVQEVYAAAGTRVVIVDWDEKEADPSTFRAGELTPLPLTVMPEEAEGLLRESE